MDSNIIVAMISLLGTLGGSLGGILSAATKKYMGKGYCPVYAREALTAFMRAIMPWAGMATDEDKSRLAEIEGQAEALRAEIAEMGEG